MNFRAMSIKELRAFAAEEGVDLGEAKTKTEVLSVLLNVNVEVSEEEETAAEGVITGPEKKKSSPNSNVVTNDDDGIFRSAAADRRPQVVEQEAKPEPEKAAIHSDGNMRWAGLGEIKKGYNIVTKEAAAKWVTRRGVREATPKEVATYHGI